MTVNGEGLAICHKLQQEGVKVYVGFVEDLNDTVVTGETKKKKEELEEKKKRFALFDGMLKNKMTAKELVNLIKREARPDDSFILCDFNTTFKYAQQVSDLGITGIFPTEEDRQFETDRDKGKEFVKKNYKVLKVAEEFEYKKVDEAIKFLESSNDVFVVKSSSDEFNGTYVPTSDEPEEANKTIINKLLNEKKEYERYGFILEKKIKNAIEITPEIWFKDGKPLCTSVDIELKRIAAGDVGFMTGSAGGLILETDLDAEINRIAFPKAVYELAKGHKGVFIWDASILFDPEDGTPYFGEFCPNRPGYDCFFNELAQFDVKKDFFEAVMKGENPYENKVGQFSSAVRIFSFVPKGGGMMVPEDKVVEADEDSWRDFWPLDIKKKDDEYSTVGFDYQLGIVTGFGDTIEASAKRAYMYVDGISFEDKVYRNKKDYLSTDYPSSIVNRYKWGKKNGMF